MTLETELGRDLAQALNTGALTQIAEWCETAQRTLNDAARADGSPAAALKRADASTFRYLADALRTVIPHAG